MDSNANSHSTSIQKRSTDDNSYWQNILKNALVQVQGFVQPVSEDGTELDQNPFSELLSWRNILRNVIIVLPEILQAVVCGLASNIVCVVNTTATIALKVYEANRGNSSATPASGSHHI